MSWECPELRSTSQQGAHVIEAKGEDGDLIAVMNAPKEGEPLLLKRVLIQVEKKKRDQITSSKEEFVYNYV